MTGIYDDPALYGLTIIAAHDAGLVDQFDVVALWRDHKGDYYIGHDHGSCVMPFRGVKVQDLTQVRSVAEVEGYARGAWDHLDDVSWCLEPDQRADAAVTVFTQKVASALVDELDGD